MKNLFSKILFVGRTSLFFFRNLKLFLYLYLYWDLHFYNHCNVSSWSGEQLVLWLILIGSSSPSAAPSQKSGHRPTFGPICPTITNNRPKSSQSSHQPQHIFWSIHSKVYWINFIQSKKTRIYFLTIVLAVFENFKFHRSIAEGAFSLLIFMRMIAFPQQLGTEKDEGQISRNCQLKCRRFDLKRSFQRNKVKFKRKSILTCLWQNRQKSDKLFSVVYCLFLIFTFSSIL